MLRHARVGDQHSVECHDPQIRYRGWILRVVDDEEDVRHLGFWATPNGDWKGIVDRVHASTLETINIVKHSDKYRFSILIDTHSVVYFEEIQ